jgi:Na+-transporting NADH:ubiquinone oxidoreductase subunit B
MKFILEFMEKKIKPLYGPGGRLSRLFPLYEAGDTFLFTPAETTSGPPHVRDALDMKRYMIVVIAALMPCLLFGIYNAGRQYDVINQTGLSAFGHNLYEGALLVLPIVIVSYVVGGLWEVLFAVVRKHEINEGFLVTGLLFPLTLPPTTPLWQVALGITFGVVVGKEIFGGTGFNVLNPALTGRAFLFFAYPAQITGDGVWTKVADASHVVEGFTGATPLAIAGQVGAGEGLVPALERAGFTLKSMALGLEGGSIGETSLIPILLGAAVLLLTGVGAWRIMAGGVLGVSALAVLIDLVSGPDAKPFAHLPFYYHFAMGSFAFGIVFMATDPVSAAATRAGKWIYGFLIGALTVLIRVVNPAYPEGVMLSILFMNIMAPLIDHYVVQVHIRRRAAYLRSFRHA